jgi:hypothetical protein
MYTGSGLGDVDLSKLKQGKISVGGVSIDTKSPAKHIAERIARALPLKDKAIHGDNTAWAQLWQASGRDLPVRSVDAVPENSSKTVGWPRVKPQISAMLREIEDARGVPSPGNTTPGQPSSAFPSYNPGGADSASDASSTPKPPPSRGNKLLGLDSGNLLMLAGIGLFVFEEMGKKRGRGRRR